jgi:hypothetical protein
VRAFQRQTVELVYQSIRNKEKTYNIENQEMISILRQQSSTSSEIAQETEASLKRKISELEDAIFQIREQNENSGSELESARAECRQMIDLNAVLSQQV